MKLSSLLKKAVGSIVLLLLCFIQLSSQGGIIAEGYTFEKGNRGYLSLVDIKAIDKASGQVLVEIQSDVDGRFELDLPPVEMVELVFIKEMFKEVTKEITNTGSKQFLKVEMERKPGYLFEITLADRKDSVNQVVDALIGTLIEVYNNTTEKLVLKLENHPSPEFKLPMEKGNHYTILVRKKGYLAKQMEAYVNVKGCILCFEGVSNVRPGVTENLTEGNEYGTLLANVEMDRIFSGKTFEVKNLLYDLNSAKLRTESKKELDKVINILRYNPNLMLELGSHTDSRGREEFNMDLSERRAKSAVKYITDVGGIPAFRIQARGYGELLLKNECSDDVTCSEKKHQENRRTEIKVLGIEEDWIFKPLVNIKNEIKMEREIFQMINGKSEAISEEEYKKLKEKEKNATKAVSKIPDEVVKSNSEAINQETSEDAMVLDKSEIQASEDELVAAKNVEVDKELPKQVMKEESNSPASVEKPLVENEYKAERKVIEESEKADEIGKGSIIPKTDISNGFKVIIHYSVVPLPDGHPLFDKHENMETYVSPEGNRYYMIPGFESDVEAQEAIDTKYKAVYPGAYIAAFIDGKRVY